MKKFIVIFSILLRIFCLPSTKKTKRELEKSNDIVILHTNDVHCGVQDTIGYDGLMLFKKQLLKKYNNVILVDAGDHIQGGTMGLISGGEAIIDILNKLGYEVATLGNHEFDYGIDQLETVEKLLNCSYISSNYCYKKDKKSIYPPYKIIEKGGKKIGFIGVATPQTLSKTYLITLKDDKGELIYDFLTENHSQELYDRVQQHIDELQEQDVDYIIILAHLGMYGDALEENTSAGLLKNLKNVNTLIDGHSHRVYSMTTPDKDDKKVILVQTGTKLANIGVITIHENGTLSHYNLDEVPYDPDLASETVNDTRSEKIKYVDKEMYEYINDIFDSFSDQLNQVIGKSDFLLNVFKNASESTESHTQLSRTNENALCNLVTDAMKELGEADVSIMNAGAVRTDINKGNITYQNVINTMPFSNDILVKEITGQTILEALDFGVRTLPGVTSRFPQVSGITFKVDTSINSSVIVDENEVFQKLGKEQRVYDIKVNGEKLDLNKKYTIASNSFMLGGGDGYSMFSNCETLKTSIGVDNEVLLEYIQKNLNGTILSKYRTTDGRMIKTNGKIYGDINISLLGFDNLTFTPELITFNEYIVSLEKINFEFPKQLKLKAFLSKSSRLRALQDIEKNISCYIQNEVNETCVKYLCEIPGDTSNINTIKIQPDFNNFNVKLSPLAIEYMSNLTEIINDKTFVQNLLNKKNYILHDAIYYKKGGSLLIYGNINNNNYPSFSKNELTLIAKQLPENIRTNLNCIVDQEKENNYVLSCKINPNIEYNLDNSILIDEDKILIINFAKDANSKIRTSRARKYYTRSSGLKPGIIALIVIIPIVIIAITAGLIIFLRKSPVNPNIRVPTVSSTDIIK